MGPRLVSQLSSSSKTPHFDGREESSNNDEHLQTADVLFRALKDILELLRTLLLNTAAGDSNENPAFILFEDN